MTLNRFICLFKKWNPLLTTDRRFFMLHDAIREFQIAWNVYLQDPDFFVPAFIILSTLTFILCIVESHSKYDLSYYTYITVGLTIGSLMLALIYVMHGGTPLYLELFAFIYFAYGVTYFAVEILYGLVNWLFRH